MRKRNDVRDVVTASNPLALCLLLCLILAGCGGGGGGTVGSATTPVAGTNSASTTPTAAGATGSVQMTVTRDGGIGSAGQSSARTIPSNTAAIEIKIQGASIDQKTPFPTNVNTLTITVNGVPLGTQTITVNALDPNGIVLATATVSVLVTAGVTTASVALMTVAPTPQDYLYAGIVTGSTPGLVQIDLSQPLPTTASPTTTLSFSPNEMCIVPGQGGVPYLYVAGTMNSNTVVLGVFDPVSLTQLAPLKTLSHAGVPLPNTMRCDPVHGFLYIPGISSNVVDVVNVGTYDGSASTASIAEVLPSLPVHEPAALAVDPSTNPSFYLIGELAGEINQIDSYPIVTSSITGPRRPILSLSAIAQSMDVTYAPTAVGLAGLPGTPARLQAFNPTQDTIGGSPVNLPIPNKLVPDVRFELSNFGASAVGARALVTGDNTAAPGQIFVVFTTAGSFSLSAPQPLTGFVPPSNTSAPTFIAFSNAQHLAFVADTSGNGNIYVVNMDPDPSDPNSQPAYQSTINLGPSTSILTTTVFQPAGPFLTH